MKTLFVVVIPSLIAVVIAGLILVCAAAPLFM